MLATDHLDKASEALANIKMINSQGNERRVKPLDQISGIVGFQHSCKRELGKAYLRLEEFLPKNVLKEL